MRAPIGFPAARHERPAPPPAAGSSEGAGSDLRELARARLFGLLAEERSLRAPRAPALAAAAFQPLPPADRRRSAARGGILGFLSGLWASYSRLRSQERLRGLRLPTQVGVISLIVYLVLFNFSIVRGSSMAPGIRDGDRILIDHVSYLFREVKRGDVVVLRYPLDPSVDYIKRVVGLPGDEIRILGAQVFVNGELLEEPYVAEPDRRAYLSTIVLPEHYFVLGDNRPHSADSREFGLVPRACLRGKVDLRVWPIRRAGLVD